jgi:hypothetical protein
MRAGIVFYKTGVYHFIFDTLSENVRAEDLKAIPAGGRAGYK